MTVPRSPDRVNPPVSALATAVWIPSESLKIVKVGKRNSDIFKNVLARFQAKMKPRGRDRGLKHNAPS